MSNLRLLGIALALSAVGFLLLWAGAWFADVVLWIGLMTFSIGMLLGPLGRYIAEDEDEGAQEE